MMSLFIHQQVYSTEDLFIPLDSKTSFSCSFLNSYDSTGVENRETELFGKFEFKVDSFEVYSIEFGN